ncbi:MAG: hypothetical protein JWO31_850, partial [Phycisphaerales bacterium]|nr:hypothetical protein [Phycisphaerales bacterium]
MMRGDYKPIAERRSLSPGAKIAGLFGTWCVLCLSAAAAAPGAAAAASEPDAIGVAYDAQVRPLVRQYCVGCHSAERHKGSLDLDRFATAAGVRKELKPWRTAAELVEAGEMPPKGEPQPTAEERGQLVAWVRRATDAEARAQAGDPGRVPLRRLSNAEYDYTVRDLTGVDLRPAREFPADGAAGEGFTNAAEALTDVSPVLLNKYLMAAKGVAAHAVLLPDGFRFSVAKTRRDWSDESIAKLRQFYAPFGPDGRLPLGPYLAVTVRHRDALLSARTTPEAVAAGASLSPTYVRALWEALAGDEPSFVLAPIRARWRRAGEGDVAALAADVAAWQAKVWKVVPIGSYRDGNTTRQLPVDTAVGATQTLRLAASPGGGGGGGGGGGDVVVRLSAHELSPAGASRGRIVWVRPRLEGAKKPTLLLRDYPTFGPAYEVDYPAAFADTARYLDALIVVVNDPARSVADVAKASALDAGRLQRWVDVLAVEPADKSRPGRDDPGRVVPAVPLELLGEKAPPDPRRSAINGWRPAGAELPTLVANSSGIEEHIPGRASPHAVAVHPTPTEFV